ncbi:MAG: SMC-Scp complex subunit ScpB [Oscillospiraceae bacterium]|nr:SMC-Scp complex subunit ScpB [Oscillospiraceae bacterium]
MQLNEKIGAIEAILFSSGEPVEEFRLAESAGVNSSELSSLIKTLNDRYTDNESGIEILKLGAKYQMCTRKKYAEYVKTAMESKKQTPLSQAAMEALTVVAYNQPVTKGFVESVRGIDSSSVINTLVDKGLLEEDSRLDVPGHPVAYRTTDTFLRSFGLSSLDDLPPLEREEENRQQSLLEDNNEE